jgi:stearoyl-CoA 9-desaturase NADPH oxidoreductase
MKSFRTESLRAAAKRLFLDEQAEFWLGELRATWSLRELRARVVAITDETPDTKTFVLRVGRRWPGHVPGQYVPVEIELDGVRVRRCYSISGATARTIAITVRRVPGGRVSPWLHAHLRVGDVLRLGRPAGELVVRDATAPLLFVGGGSGMTPIIAMLRALPADALARATVVQCARTGADALFTVELRALAAAGLTVIEQRDDRDGYVTVEKLARLGADRDVYACGPPGLLAACAAAVPAERLVVERFEAPRPLAADPGASPARTSQVRLSRSQKLVVLTGAGTLLEQLERAGERPAHGCRMGICNTCRCTKVAGVVADAATGAISDGPDESIRLCTSIARSDLTLDL